MTSDVQDSALAASPILHQPVKKTGRELRWERRRRRLWLEEFLGWLLVPVIVLASYWLVETVLNALGTSLPQILTGLGAIASGKVAP